MADEIEWRTAFDQADGGPRALWDRVGGPVFGIDASGRLATSTDRGDVHAATKAGAGGTTASAATTAVQHWRSCRAGVSGEDGPDPPSGLQMTSIRSAPTVGVAAASKAWSRSA